MPNWSNNRVQFARLISEIAGALDESQTKDLIVDLCRSMDLSPNEVIELFDRAERMWELDKMQEESFAASGRSRCTAHMPESYPPDEPQPAVPGGQCGLPEGHSGPHTLLFDTTASWIGNLRKSRE